MGIVTAALRAGRGFELYLFERAQFDRWFVVKPEDHNGKTNKGLEGGKKPDEIPVARKLKADNRATASGC